MTTPSGSKDQTPSQVESLLSAVSKETTWEEYVSAHNWTSSPETRVEAVPGCEAARNIYTSGEDSW
jgi:hypothetical protein